MSEPGRLRGWPVALLIALTVTAALAPGASAASMIDEVNPFVGTEAGFPDFGTGGGAGNTFPGASAPFGMVSFSPDTIPSTVNYAGGYTYSDSRLRGFSLTHFSGAGCAAYQDVPILPTTAPITRSPVVAGSSDMVPEVVPEFDHRHESASPGYYGVTLDPGTREEIRADLTATTRTAVGRFRFPRTRQASVLINPGGSKIADFDARVRIDPRRREVTGSAESGAFCYQPGHYRVYFAARFDRPFASHATWVGSELRRGSRTASDSSPDAVNYTPIAGGPPAVPGNPSTTAQAGAVIGFDTRRKRAVGVHVGVSFVSVAGARANLRESAGRTFPELRRRARRRWARKLGAIRIGGGRRADRRTFATALYHAQLEPSVASDRDGRYRGMDGKVHRTRRGAHYTDVSGWDVYRSQTQLTAMLDPGRASAIARSLLADRRKSGCWPRWPFAGTQTNVMVGDPSAPIIASSRAFGARRFDAAATLRALVRGASRRCHVKGYDYTEREGLEAYLRLGWIPYQLDVGAAAHTVSRHRPWGVVSTALEYQLADFSIGRLAAATGHRAIARRFAARARRWRAMVDPATRTIAPRNADGSFVPTAPSDQSGYVEGNAAQYSWFVPWDPAGLFASMGGRAEARARLGSFFSELNAGPASPHAFLGNEPSLGMPWLFDWVGRPSRTQEIVRRAQLGLYGPGPGGLPGNDDGGTMSAWWVLSALGFYPAVPGTGILALDSPLFRRASIRLPRGRVRILAPRAGRHRPYVRSLRLDGRPRSKPWLRYSDLSRGATLRWGLGARPTRWGRGVAAAPPSFR